LFTNKFGIRGEVTVPSTLYPNDKLFRNPDLQKLDRETIEDLVKFFGANKND